MNQFLWKISSYLIRSKLSNEKLTKLITPRNDEPVAAKNDEKEPEKAKITI